MTRPEQSHEPLATPAQAAALLTEVGTLTTLQGENYDDRNTFSTPVTEMPPEVAFHLPEAHSDSSEVKDSVYIKQIFDAATGRPKRDGIVGAVTFTRREKVNADVTYAAHVNYHITTKDGETYGLERYVANTVPYKAREVWERLGRSMLDPSGSARGSLRNMISLRDRLNDSRSTEQAMGMFDVTRTEAQQVIDFTKGLNGEG